MRTRRVSGIGLCRRHGERYGALMRPVPTVTEERPCPVDIPAMRANFAKAAATGDEAPLYFYSTCS